MGAAKRRGGVCMRGVYMDGHRGMGSQGAWGMAMTQVAGDMRARGYTVGCMHCGRYLGWEQHDEHHEPEHSDTPPRGALDWSYQATMQGA